MPDLEQLWRNMLDDASSRAEAGGRLEVVEFLRLKIANDTIRKGAMDWLFITIDQIASELSGSYRLTIARTSPHIFRHGHSNMVGSLIDIKYGVRCFSAEAGWARTPTDGVMRKGALAQARFRHFGLPSETADYRLVRGEGLPVWLGPDNAELSTDEIRRQLRILVEG